MHLRDYQVETKFEQLIKALKEKFSRFNDDELADAVKEFRDKNGHTLRGFAFDEVVEGTLVILVDRERILKQKKQRSVAGPSKGITVATEEFNEVRDPSEVPYCSVCQNVLDNGINVDDTDEVLEFDCSHKFHSSCIRRWLELNRSCPVCRASCLLSDEYPKLSA